VNEPTTPERRHLQARSFGPVALLYDEVRPTYPQAAVDWALEPLGPSGKDGWRVLDVGAGTGIMTRVLRALGHQAIAVEPDPLMRQRLADTTDVHALPGSAEDIPLPDGSIDAAIAAQAYHWFDHDRAHQELGRVIRDGGIFAAIWNDRDTSTDWLQAYTAIVEGDRGPDGTGPCRRPDATTEPRSYGELFSELQTASFLHSVRTTPQSLVRLLQSRSYFLTATPARQAALEQEVRDLAANHPDLAGKESFELPYVTVVYRAVRV
jgi:SAM-dependent methyltransferase